MPLPGCGSRAKNGRIVPGTMLNVAGNILCGRGEGPHAEEHATEAISRAPAWRILFQAKQRVLLAHKTSLPAPALALSTAFSTSASTPLIEPASFMAVLAGPKITRMGEIGNLTVQKAAGTPLRKGWEQSVTTQNRPRLLWTVPFGIGFVTFAYF